MIALWETAVCVLGGKCKGEKQIPFGNGNKYRSVRRIKHLGRGVRVVLWCFGGT